MESVPWICGPLVATRPKKNNSSPTATTKIAAMIAGWTEFLIVGSYDRQAGIGSTDLSSCTVQSEGQLLYILLDFA